MRPLLSILIVAMALTACHKKEATEDTRIPDIAVAPVQIDSVTLYKEYPATLRAIKVVDVVARVDGYLRAQHYKAGDRVKKGQVLFSIEDTQYRNAVEQAEASLTSAQATYDYASREYEALKKALESDAVSQMEVVQGKSNLDAAVASIKNAKASLETARTNLGYCTVCAPYDGVMTSSGPDVGAYLSGSVSPVTLATIYDDSELLADFYIEDASYLRMFTNDNNRRYIDFDSIPIAFSEVLPHAYVGRLTYMAPDVDESTGTLKVRAQITNNDYQLRDGMYCTISLPYKVDPKAILVKDASISTDQLGKFVYTVTDSDRVEYTPIKIGSLVNDSMRVVTDGLTPTSRYVTEALLKVRSGMPIHPVP
ncbi:MAG: efflux RND transporter periplasmic adaptor subunit [Bacteroidales bacterium]|nr:efflux RND transporter periplasmic adaptor subunit [Bacteroidales bacterium]